MKFTVHVSSTDAIPAAREAVEATMQSGDELEIIVNQPVARPVERNERRPAGGTAAGMKGA